MELRVALGEGNGSRSNPPSDLAPPDVIVLVLLRIGTDPGMRAAKPGINVSMRALLGSAVSMQGRLGKRWPHRLRNRDAGLVLRTSQACEKQRLGFAVLL